jgi:AraC family transcriptional regulator
MRVDVQTLFSGAMLRIIDWRCMGHDPEPFGGEEWIDSPEIVVVRRGAFIRRSAGREVFIDPGTVAFHEPDQCYRVRHPLGGDTCSAFQLTPRAAAELTFPAEQDELEGPPVRFPRAVAPLDGRAFLLHRLAVQAARDPASTPLEIEELAVGFLRAAMASASERVTASRPTDRANRQAAEYAVRAREVVARRFREPLTVGTIALEVGCSPFHLHRIVTAVAGVPLHRSVLRLRLRDALERLLATSDSVSAIAYATGFASHSHLTDAFRREYGQSPSAVRRLAVRELRPLRERAGVR